MLEFCSTDHWRSICALTFNLKKVFKDSNGCSRWVDESTAKKVMRDYANRLNRLIYKGAYRNYGKRLRIIPILEQNYDQRWHYHVSIEPPAHMTANEFCQVAMTLWERMPLGYGHGKYKIIADRGWLLYLSKFRTKYYFENYYDCIDLDAYYNPFSSD